MDEAQFGWFGKHPAFADFVSRDVSEPVRNGLQDWLDGALRYWRDASGEGWASAYDAAPTVRFWIGARVLGQVGSGVMVPSRDKVGRRYPLILLTGGSPLPPPLAPEQTLFDSLSAQARTLLADADMPRSAAIVAEGVDDALWASNPSAAADSLLEDIAAEDMARAAQGRSYWWTERSADRTARVISATRLPDEAQLAWLLDTEDATLNATKGGPTDDDG